MKNKIFILLSLLISFVMAASLLSCGSGGSSGGDGPGTGSIAILLTDAPTDDYLEINITIKKIELLADDRHVTIFSEDNSDDYLHIDLLDLRNETSLLSIEDNIPAISYNKIRLTIDEAVLIDNNHNPHQLDLTGNNKIDLNPRGHFHVRPGEMLTLYLDIDLSKDDNAIHVVETGSGKYKLRPEVFVEILDAVHMMKIMRFTGMVSNIEEDRFKLCSVVSDFHITDIDDYINHMEKDICIYVYVTGNTSFFQASDGEPIMFDPPEDVLEDILKDGDIITVIGFFKAIPAVQDSDDNDLKIGMDAVVVEIGYFARLKGTIISGISGDQFVFRIAPGQGYAIDFEMNVEVQEKTKIYTWDGENTEESNTDAITEDRLVEIDGIIIKQGTNDVLNSAFILIDIPQSEPT